MRLGRIEGIVRGAVRVEGVVGVIVIRFTTACATKNLVTKQFISTFLLYSKSSLVYITDRRYYSNSSSNDF